MNAQQVVNAMIEIEFKEGIEPDAQREIRDARMRLQAACNAPEPDNSVRPHGARDIQPSKSKSSQPNHDLAIRHQSSRD